MPTTASVRVDLTDPELFSTGRFHPVLAWLRDNAPVWRHPEPDGSGFWVLSRHHDVLAAYRDRDAFSSRFGMRLGSNPAAVEAVAQQMMIVSDPPDHTRVRRVVARALGPASAERMSAAARDAVVTVLDAVVAAPELDLLTQVRRVPNYVICGLMGLPRNDWDWMGATATAAFESGDEAARSAAHADIFVYFSELVADRRGRHGDDLVSQLVAASAGEPAGRLSDDEIVVNCNGVLAGANETTRYSIAGGVLALAERPDQWDRLRAGGPAAVPAAVEEILRWTTPGVHALRTAVRPARIGGTDIAVGERVTLWNTSANRDGAVFPDPDRFDVGRTPNRHVTFGYGPHLCVGARLARIVLGAFFEGFSTRVRSVALAGEPVFTDSNFTWGLRSLPVRLAAS